MFIMENINDMFKKEETPEEGDVSKQQPGTEQRKGDINPDGSVNVTGDTWDKD